MKNCRRRNIVIRTDGSTTVGMGHVMRCIGLAQEFRRRHFDVLFALGLQADAVTGRLDQEGLKYQVLATRPGSDEDLKWTLDVIRQQSACLVVVDGYVYQGDWLERLGAANAKVLLWTDFLQSDRLPVDIILDQTPQADPIAYRRACPHGKILAGLGYCVLRDEFTGNPEMRRLRSDCDKLLITMGGSDPSQMTMTVLGALLEHESAFDTRVIVGPANPVLGQIEERGRKLKRCRVEIAVSDMSSLIAWADIAITAAGITLWEFAYSGLPAIAVSVADNQRKLAESMQQFGGGIDLGDAHRATKSNIWEALCLFANDRQALEVASGNMMRQVDGLGAPRVVDEAVPLLFADTIQNSCR